MNKFDEFVSYLNKTNTKVWIRSVIVPGLNDNKDYILKLDNYLKNLANIEKVELLPYHLYGVDKYKKLNIKYPLEGVKPMDISSLKNLEDYLK